MADKSPTSDADVILAILVEYGPEMSTAQIWRRVPNDWRRTPAVEGGMGAFVVHSTNARMAPALALLKRQGRVIHVSAGRGRTPGVYLVAP